MPSSLVNWTDHSSFLQRQMRFLFKSGLFSDFEIRCNGKIYKVHKLILGMFTDYFWEYDGLWINMDLEQIHLEAILRFIYLGKVVIQYDHMEGFLDTCRFLRLRLFTKVSEDAAIAAFHDRNIYDPQNAADRLKGAPDSAAADNNDEDEESLMDYREQYELNDFQLLCRRCFKCFPDEKLLKRHTWGCHRIKTFKCQHCDEWFRHKNDVIQHTRKHTLERPFVCPREGCNRDFSQKASMVMHIKVDHDKIPYKCKFCEKEFRTPMQRREHHMTAHSTKRSYPCKMCSESFPTPILRNVHMGWKHKTKAQKRQARRKTNERYHRMQEEKKKQQQEEAN